jgi:NAD(P)-dependent dehydrogenase (short-subunit alcohol dehydrogenase family)
MKAESVLVTGTTSGVGRALLELYARRGARIISVNRRRDPELESRYPQVRFECVDVRAAEEVALLLRRLAQSAELPDVFILNAGINRTDNDESFDLSSFRSVIDTNLYGVLSFVEPLTRLPTVGAPRHLVAISSMVNYVGNPYGLGYTTSKRALTTCFDVWSKMYSGTDLIFQRVMLGPVRTGMYTMHESFPAWMVWIKNAFSGSPESTARAVARFAEKRKRTLFYPWPAIPLFLGLSLCRSFIPGFLWGRMTRAGKARRREQLARASEHDE